jgi:hypothetical protein
MKGIKGELSKNKKRRALSRMVIGEIDILGFVKLPENIQSELTL